ncbi:MAG: hypothetical protein K9I74_01305 [Bacteroidales bacterium]|nr:hypothetical protein [Bacteroidales bacterium]
MHTKIFDDIPGVGEIYIYRGSDREIFQEKGHELHFGKNYWIDNLAYRLLNRKEPLLLQEFENEVGELDYSNLVKIPFIDVNGRYISFTQEKFHVAAVCVSFYERFIKGVDLDLLDTLMPYDIISYLRPAITGEDGEPIINAIENSNNPHYIRFLFLLLRRCGVEGNVKWEKWLKNYIEKLPNEINSYPEFTVQRDARVTLTTVEGKEPLFPFVDRMMNEPQLVEYETRHFIESCETPERAGDILYWKIVQSGYRQSIAPINVFSIHKFASEHVIELLNDIKENHEHEKMREIAAVALNRI